MGGAGSQDESAEWSSRGAGSGGGRGQRERQGVGGYWRRPDRSQKGGEVKMKLLG